MNLWIWYAEGTREQIEAACLAANAEILRRGFTVREAFNAAMDAVDFEEDRPGEAPTDGADALIAWYAAERVALETLAQLVGTWPEQATMIFTESKA